MVCVYLAAISLAATQQAFAGDFSVFCSYKNSNLEKCASVVSDVVTDKFVAKFPADKFQIFVHSNVMAFTDGGFSAYAVAGVIPKDSAQFPVRTFSSTQINGTERKFNQIELANVELETYRAVVRNLMENCEISPNCDVYTARKK
jgi:hypothetical protein